MSDLDKIYAVVDTNVIVSAMLSSNKTSNPNIVVRALNTGLITPLYNDIIINEYKEVLSRPQFKLNQYQIEFFIETLKKFGIKTEAVRVNCELFPDRDDVVFYAVRMAVDDSYLVTGNIKHFPKKPFVVTPAEMVLILKEKNLI